MEEGLRVIGEMLQGHLVEWSCDNRVVAQIVRLGSMESKCHEVATRIRGLAQPLTRGLLQ